MNDSLKQHIQKITKLPTLPVIAQEILSLINERLLSVDKLENIIQNDPAISAKVLSVANSTYFGSELSTKTLNSAIMRIGFNNVKNIALGVSLMTVMKGGKGGNAIDYQRVFNHSVSVGFVARILAADLKLKFAEEIMVDGLLHDLGFLVLNRYFSDTYNKVMDTFNDEISLLDAEKKVLDFTHAEIGGWLAEQWKLPATILYSVLYHHTPSLAVKNLKRVAVIHIADYMTTKSIMGPAKGNLNYMLHPSALEVLGIEENDLEDLNDKISGGIYSE